MNWDRRRVAVTTLKAIAAALSMAGVKPSFGQQWHPGNQCGSYNTGGGNQFAEGGAVNDPQSVFGHSCGCGGSDEGNNSPPPTNGFGGSGCYSDCSGGPVSCYYGIEERC